MPHTRQPAGAIGPCRKCHVGVADEADPAGRGSQFHRELPDSITGLDFPRDALVGTRIDRLAWSLRDLQNNRPCAEEKRGDPTGAPSASESNSVIAARWATVRR